MKAGYWFALIKREYMQHYGALWVTPLVLLCLVQIGAFFSGYLLVTEVDMTTTFTMENESYFIEQDLQKFMSSDKLHFQPAVAFFVFAVIIALFYLLDSLYADRKDKSILFWRSLPVSEYENVASKLLVSVILIPFSFLLVGSIASLLAALILLGSLVMAGIDVGSAGNFILYFSGLKYFFQPFITILLASILLLPLHLGLLLISAIAKRGPLLSLILGLLGLTLIELLIFQQPKTLPFLGQYIETVARGCRNLAHGEASGLGMGMILLILLLSAAQYFVCVLWRIKKFEI